MNLIYYTQFRKVSQRIGYFLGSFGRYLLPAACFRLLTPSYLRNRKGTLDPETEKRVAYYCRPLPQTLPDNEVVRIRDFKFPFGQKKKHSNYFFDLYQHLVYFKTSLCFRYEFGDIDYEMPLPTLVKSRPVVKGDEPSNSVILKLNRKRHYVFIKDSKSFREKKDMLVSRNVVRQPHRIRLLEMFMNHPMCNLGQINKDTPHGHPEWIRPYMSIQEQLSYKFICCIEGNDVATNLKWVMSSNSLPVMPPPTCESWFMEGTLIPDYHYVAIRPDYSDLIEKLEYYICHPEKAEEIIRHNHAYIRKFQDRKSENKISRLVLQRYFELTGQL